MEKMKFNKKSFVLIQMIILGVMYGNAETLTYEQLKDSENPKHELEKKYEAYTASDKHTYRVGDDIVIGTPSSNKTFAFLESQLGIADEILNGAESARLDIRWAGSKMKIKKIKVERSKKRGAAVSMRAYLHGLGGILIQFENALQSGEIKGFGMSSDDALKELKKEKDKFDLGIITEEEFNKKKEELTKFIK